MRNLSRYLDGLLYIAELGVVAIGGWLLRPLIVDNLPFTIKLGQVMLEGKWIVLPILLALVVAIVWWFHKSVRARLAKQSWWTTGDDAEVGGTSQH